jgi:hypothetical protein
MEVHAHSHTARKKWTHYLWEFLMLFLAVFCGFLAENQREHYIEHQREKKYAQLLYNDLKLDLSRLEFIKSVKLLKGAKFDSLMTVLASEDLREHAANIYYYSLFIFLTQKFSTQDATMQQLRSSGNLRYFKNQELYNSISQYYTLCTFYLDRELEGESQIVYPAQLIAKIFDTRLLMGNFSIKADFREAIRMPAGNPQLLTVDKPTINEYYLFIANEKRVNDLSLFFSENIRKNAEELMSFLKKEYKVE